MYDTEKLPELGNAYLRLLLNIQADPVDVRTQETEFVGCFNACSDQALPPELRFLFGYIAIVNGGSHDIHIEKGLAQLEQAHEEGCDDATLFLAEIYEGDKFLPWKFRVAGRYEHLLGRLLEEGNPHALYLKTKFMGEHYTALKDDDPEKPALEEEALALLGELEKTGYCGFHYLIAVWANDGPGPGFIMGVDTHLQKAIDLADPKKVAALPIISDAKFRLGLMKFKGRFITKDIEGAITLIREAAMMWHEEAQKWLKDNGYEQEDDEGNGGDSPLSFFTKKKQAKKRKRPVSEEQARRDEMMSGGEDCDSCDYSQDSRPKFAKFNISYPEGEYDPAKTVDPDALLAPFDDFTGMGNVREEIRKIVVYGLALKTRKAAGLTVRNVGLHMVFAGSPGTGKTTVARILGQILYHAGILAKGHVVEVDRSNLIGRYVGDTTRFTRDACDAADGGILFIDEAYSISETPWYGEECIDTLVKRMEDEADNFMVIAAGYASKMEPFLMANPGLRARFSQTLRFRDFSVPDLVPIFLGYCRKYDYTLDDFAQKKLEATIKAFKSKEGARFANARSVRNLFDTVIKRQAARVVRDGIMDRKALMALTAADFEDGEGPGTSGTVTPLRGKR